MHGISYMLEVKLQKFIGGYIRVIAYTDNDTSMYQRAFVGHNKVSGTAPSSSNPQGDGCMTNFAVGGPAIGPCSVTARDLLDTTCTQNLVDPNDLDGNADQGSDVNLPSWYFQKVNKFKRVYLDQIYKMESQVNAIGAYSGVNPQPFSQQYLFTGMIQFYKQESWRVIDSNFFRHDRDHIFQDGRDLCHVERNWSQLLSMILVYRTESSL